MNMLMSKDKVGKDYKFMVSCMIVTIIDYKAIISMQVTLRSNALPHNVYFL